jgi:ribosomal protein L7/L12
MYNGFKINENPQGDHESSGSMYDGPVEVVLVEVGDTPRAIAEVIKEVMNLTIQDTDALCEALPITLFKNLPRSNAEKLRHRLRAHGADVEFRVPRDKNPGLRGSSSPLMSS